MPNRRRENIPKLLLLGRAGEENFCGSHEIEVVKSFVLLIVITQRRRRRRPIVAAAAAVSGGWFAVVGGGAKGSVRVEFDPI